MGESWKPSHEKKTTVYDLAKDAVKETPAVVKAAPLPEPQYHGPERRSRTRKRWRIGLSFELDERAEK